ILGAGVGWMKEDIELFGVPYERRGAWSDEAIRVMKACWRDERVSHRGQFVRFEALGVAPKPAQGTIPVWIGGHTTRALRRVAELGDGWHAAFPNAAKVKTGLADLASACRTVGRDLKSLTISARLERHGALNRRPRESDARRAGRGGVAGRARDDPSVDGGERRRRAATTQ